MYRRDFEAVVDAVLDELPEWVLARIDNLIVVVEEHPTRDQDPDGNGLLGISFMRSPTTSGSTTIVSTNSAGTEFLRRPGAGRCRL
jgi:hypothetical protein